MTTLLKLVIRYLAISFIVIMFLLPLYWAVVASLREPGLPPSLTVEWWPPKAHWENYINIFRNIPMGRYTLNSLVVEAAAVPITLIVASLTGFAIAQLSTGTRLFFILLSIILMMVPGMALWISRYQILHWLGLIDSLWALILPAFAASNPLFVLLFYWSFRHIPQEIYESGQMEGANALIVWWRLAMPIVQPTTVAVSILTFVMYWSDFTSPVMYIYDPKRYTLAVGLQILKQYDATNWPLLMAGAVFMIVPVIVLFVILQFILSRNVSLSHLLEAN
jgi:multiple sugar transport system permease protein